MTVGVTQRNVTQLSPLDGVSALCTSNSYVVAPDYSTLLLKAKSSVTKAVLTRIASQPLAAITVGTVTAGVPGGWLVAIFTMQLLQKHFRCGSTDVDTNLMRWGLMPAPSDLPVDNWWMTTF